MLREVLLVWLGVTLVGIVVGTTFETNDDLRHERRERIVVPPELLAILLPLQPVNETYTTLKSTYLSDDGCSCGVKGSTRIVGGTLARKTEWPWQAYVLIDNRFGCGGALINQYWVVTAAHCVEGSTKVVVYLGFNNIKFITKAKHISVASTTIVHEDYIENAYTVLHDIALVKLTTPVPSFTDEIKSICLPYQYRNSDLQKERATVTGWGATKEGASTVSILREVTMPILNYTQCTSRPYLYTPLVVTADMFCMYRTGADSCQGDSGGPVNWLSSENSRVYLIGVVSFGYGCARKNLPGVYTKVTNYLDWIDSNTGIINHDLRDVRNP